MIVRKIKGTEIKRTNELFALAFEFGSDESRTAEEIYSQVSSDPRSREDFDWQERWAAFEDDDITMMSFFSAKPMPVHFDGKHARMTGIGGVATLPQYRRQGGIRACFSSALPQMYADGISFSYLYPFSTAYYRQFGYESGVELIGYEVLLDRIPAFLVSGSCYLCEPGGPVPLEIALTDIQTIYRDWQSRYNLMVENEDFEYAWVTRSHPVKDQVFTWVYRNADGGAGAFATFESLGKPGKRDLICSRFFFRDEESFKGLMALARNFAADHRAIIFSLPTDRPVAHWLPEWSMGAVKRKIVPAGMVRVIDVAGVLGMARYRGDGSLMMGITDGYIPQNNGHFLVNFAEGRAREVRRMGDIPDGAAGSSAEWQSGKQSDQAADRSVDISMNIGDFSRLITGAFQSGTLPYLPFVRRFGDPSMIEKVFYPKACCITERF